MSWKLIIKNNDKNKEFEYEHDGKVMTWEEEKDCDAFRLSIEGCYRLIGYDVIKEEC